MRTAIITDTNSGASPELAKAMGIYIIPMPFSINSNDYLEGVDLDKEAFFRLQAENADITTSQPSPADITDMWDGLLEEYDAIIHIPMSSGLSGSFQTARMLAMEEKYEGRVFIINNQRISVTQLRSAIDAKLMADTGMDAEKIAAKLMDTKFDATIYITVDTLKYLKKGGRITPAAAALGTLLRIKPVLTIQGEKLDAWAKARTMKQAKSMMISAVKEDILNRFNDADGSKSHIYVVHSNSPEAAEEYLAEVREHFPGADKIEIYDLSLSVSTHTGPGALALAAVKKI